MLFQGDAKFSLTIYFLEFGPRPKKKKKNFKVRKNLKKFPGNNANWHFNYKKEKRINFLRSTNCNLLTLI